MELYERIRDEIDLLKKADNFSCQRCGSCCHGPSNPITALDLKFMKEKGIDLNGIDFEGKGFYARGELKVVEPEGCCYYYDIDTRSCKIHPYNPLVCYTYPFVVRIDNSDFYFKPCLREQNRRRDLITADLRKLVGERYNYNYQQEDQE